MANKRQRRINVLQGTDAPEGNVVAPLGTMYQQQLTTTTSAIYFKTSQAIANTPDAVGWTQVAAPVNTDAMTLAGSGLVASPLRVLGASTAGVVGGGIWARPAISDPLDSEFDTGTVIPADWTVSSGALDNVNPIDPYAGFAATGTRWSYNNSRLNWLMLQPDNGSFVLTKDISSLPANYAVWVHGCFNHRLSAAVNNDFTFGIALSGVAYDANNRVNLYLNESDAGTIQCEFSTVVGGVGTTINVTANISPTDHTPFEGFVCQRIGTTTHAWVVTNNGSMTYLGSVVYAAAVATCNIIAGNASSAAPGQMILGVDFVRFVRNTSRFFV